MSEQPPACGWFACAARALAYAPICLRSVLCEMGETLAGVHPVSASNLDAAAECFLLALVEPASPLSHLNGSPSNLLSRLSYTFKPRRSVALLTSALGPPRSGGVVEY